MKQIHSMVLSDEDYIAARKLKAVLSCKNWSELLSTLIEFYSTTCDMIEKEGKLASVPQKEGSPKKKDFYSYLLGPPRSKVEVDRRLGPLEEKIALLDKRMFNHGHELPSDVDFKNSDYERRFRNIAYLFEQMLKVFKDQDYKPCADDRKAVNVIKNGS